MVECVDGVALFSGGVIITCVNAGFLSKSGVVGGIVAPCAGWDAGRGIDCTPP